MKIDGNWHFVVLLMNLLLASISVAAEPQPESAGDAAPAADAETLFNDGRDALFRGQMEQAIDLLKQAVSLDDTKTSYKLHLARAHRYAGQTDQAASVLEQILEAAPDHVEAGQALAEIYSGKQRWEDVVRVLDPLLKYRHDYLTYHFLAEAEYNLGQSEKAREHYEEAVKLNPESAGDHYQLGNIYLAGNFFALAAESYQNALRLGLDSPVLHYKLGSAYFNLRNYFGQITERTVKSGEPGTIHQRWYLIESVPGQPDVFRCAPETSAVYQVARALDDGIEDRPDIHVLRATIYLNARRYEQAYEMFGRIASTVPEEDKALFLYYHAQAAFGTGRYDEYLKLLQEAIQLDPAAYQSTLVEAYLRVAERHNQAGQLDKYIRYLELAVDQTPQNPSLHLKLGDAYEESLDYAAAVTQWQMVLDLDPDHAQRLELLSRIKKQPTLVSVSTTDEEPDEKSQPAQSGLE
jgi:tetratricopeptide (TPR) repeat protein